MAAIERLMVEKNLAACVEQILARGDEKWIRIHRQNFVEEVSALALACRTGFLPFVKFLVNSRHCSVNEEDKLGQTALFHAAIGGSVNVLEYLFQRLELLVFHVDQLGQDTVMVAAKEHPEALQFLLQERTYDLGRKDLEGRTALYIAIDNGSFETARILLEHGAKVNVHGGMHNESILHTACRSDAKNPFELVALLCSHGADVNAKDGNKATVLQVAIEFHLFDVAEYLIDAGASINAKTIRQICGATLIMTRVLRKILKLGYRPSEGILKYAIHLGNEKVVRLFERVTSPLADALRRLEFSPEDVFDILDRTEVSHTSESIRKLGAKELFKCEIIAGVTIVQDLVFSVGENFDGSRVAIVSVDGKDFFLIGFEKEFHRPFFEIEWSHLRRMTGVDAFRASAILNLHNVACGLRRDAGFLEESLIDCFGSNVSHLADSWLRSEGSYDPRTAFRDFLRISSILKLGAQLSRVENALKAKYSESLMAQRSNLREQLINDLDTVFDESIPAKLVVARRHANQWFKEFHVGAGDNEAVKAVHLSSSISLEELISAARSHKSAIEDWKLRNDPGTFKVAGKAKSMKNLRTFFSSTMGRTGENEDNDSLETALRAEVEFWIMEAWKNNMPETETARFLALGQQFYGSELNQFLNKIEESFQQAFSLRKMLLDMEGFSTAKLRKQVLNHHIAIAERNKLKRQMLFGELEESVFDQIEVDLINMKYNLHNERQRIVKSAERYFPELFREKSFVSRLGGLNDIELEFHSGDNKFADVNNTIGQSFCRKFDLTKGKDIRGFRNHIMELQFLRKCTNLNLVAITSFEVRNIDNATIFFANEVDCTLTSWLMHGNEPSMKKNFFANGILRGILALHDHGLVHCGISTDAVKLAADESPRLADFDALNRFGSAFEFDTPLDHLVEFEAPEVKRKGLTVVSPALDIFSFGKILEKLGFEDQFGTLCVDPCERPSSSELASEVFSVVGKQVVCEVCFDSICSFLGVFCNNKEGEKHFLCLDCCDSYIKSLKTSDISECDGSFRCFMCEGRYEDFGKKIGKETQQAVVNLVCRKIEEKLCKEFDLRLEEALKAERERSLIELTVRMHHDEIIDLLNMRCPSCQKVFVDWDGCTALSCVHCSSWFCAYCFHLDENSHDSHQHVQNCQNNPTDVNDRLFPPNLQIVIDVWNKIRSKKIIKYWEEKVRGEQVQKSLRNLLRETLTKDVTGEENFVEINLNT